MNIMKIIANIALYMAATLLTFNVVAGGVMEGEHDPLPWYWQNPLPQGNFLEAVSFYDESIGMAVGARGNVLHTTDGGVSWFPVEPNLSHCMTFLDVAYIAPETAVATAYDDTCTGSEDWNSSILRTTDGGKTWVQVLDLGTDYSVETISFVDELNGMITGTHFDDQSVMALLPTWKTADGGLTWTLSVWSEFPHAVLGWNSLLMLDNNTALSGALGIGFGDGGEMQIGGVIKRTTDGGATWTVQYYENIEENIETSPVMGRVVDFAVAGSGRIIAVSQFGMILVSEDEGDTWQL